MRTKLLGIALFALTLAAVVYYPQLSAKTMQHNPPKPTITQHITASQRNRHLTYVLDWSHTVIAATPMSPKLWICPTISIPFMQR